MTQEEIKKVLERHKRWVEESEGWSEDDRANLYGADLRGANLRGADLRGAKNVSFIPYACPDFGMFIGFKKAVAVGNDGLPKDTCIVVLEIPEDAKRLSSTGRKCRCDKAKVISLQNLDGTPCQYEYARSRYDNNFHYIPGKEVSVSDFDEDRWNECSTGIHFFINRQEAVEYIL